MDGIERESTEVGAVVGKSPINDGNGCGRISVKVEVEAEELPITGV